MFPGGLSVIPRIASMADRADNEDVPSVEQGDVGAVLSCVIARFALAQPSLAAPICFDQGLRERSKPIAHTMRNRKTIE